MNHDHWDEADAFEVKMFVDNVEILSYTGQIEGDFSNGKLYYFEYLGNNQYPAQQCEDSPNGWYYDAPALDDDHYWRNHYYRTRNCAYFALGTNCDDYGDIAYRFGTTPNQACCACGGGTTGAYGPYTGTVDIPTLAPSIVPHDYGVECPDGRRLQEGEDIASCDSKFLISCGQDSIPIAEKMPHTFIPWPLEDSIKVVDRQDTTVEFQIQQNFGTPNKSDIRWIQIHYPTDEGEVCSTFYNVPYGEYTGSVKATCMAGVCSAVRVYVATTDEFIFNGSTSHVSELCETLPENDPTIRSTAGYLLYMACNAKCSLDVTSNDHRRALSLYEEETFMSLMMMSMSSTSTTSMSSSTSPQQRILQQLSQADSANGRPFSLQTTTARGLVSSSSSPASPSALFVTTFQAATTTTCFMVVVVTALVVVASL